MATLNGSLRCNCDACCGENRYHDFADIGCKYRNMNPIDWPDWAKSYYRKESIVKASIELAKTSYTFPLLMQNLEHNGQIAYVYHGESATQYWGIVLKGDDFTLKCPIKIDLLKWTKFTGKLILENE